LTVPKNTQVWIAIHNRDGVDVAYQSETGGAETKSQAWTSGIPNNFTSGTSDTEVPYLVAYQQGNLVTNLSGGLPEDLARCTRKKNEYLDNDKYGFHGVKCEAHDTSYPWISLNALVLQAIMVQNHTTYDISSLSDDAIYRALSFQLSEYNDKPDPVRGASGVHGSWQLDLTTDLEWAEWDNNNPPTVTNAMEWPADGASNTFPEHGVMFYDWIYGCPAGLESCAYWERQ
jgi:hypothetical protein